MSGASFNVFIIFEIICDESSSLINFSALVAIVLISFFIAFKPLKKFFIINIILYY